MQDHMREDLRIRSSYGKDALEESLTTYICFFHVYGYSWIYCNRMCTDEMTKTLLQMETSKNSYFVVGKI